MMFLLFAGAALLFLLAGKGTPDASAAGMSKADVTLAYQTALQTEGSKVALLEFANSLEPDYHTYAVALQTKAASL